MHVSNIAQICVKYRAALHVPVLRLGLPDRFIDHGEQGQLLAELGLDKDGIVHAVRSRTDKR